MLLFSRLLFLTSALRPARARCGAIREATPPPCFPPLLPLPGPALPLVCSFSLVLPCPPSQAPVSLALCLPVSVFPLPPRSTLRGAIRVASLPLSLHLSAPWCLGPWASGTHVALHPPVAFSPLRPPCPPLPPCPLPPLTLCRTLCRQVARMSQARTWPLSSTPSGWLAPRCGRPPLPRPRKCRRRGGATLGGALPKLRILCPKTALFCPKRPRNPLKTAKRRQTVPILHVRLVCPVTKSPLLPSNSTLCRRNGSKMAKNGLNVRYLCQTGPKRRTGRILGYPAQIRIPRAPSPTATPHFLRFPNLRITPTRRLDPRTSGHLVEPEGSTARARLGPTVGPPWSPGRKKDFFSNLFLDHLGCSNKWF